MEHYQTVKLQHILQVSRRFPSHHFRQPGQFPSCLLVILVNSPPVFLPTWTNLFFPNTLPFIPLIKTLNCLHLKKVTSTLHHSGQVTYPPFFWKTKLTEV